MMSETNKCERCGNEVEELVDGLCYECDRDLPRGPEVSV